MENIVDSIKSVNCHFVVAQNVSVEMPNIGFADILNLHLTNRVFNKAIIHIHIIGECMFLNTNLIFTPQRKHIIDRHIALNSTNTVSEIMLDFVFLIAQPLQRCIINRVALSIAGSPAEHIKSIVLALNLTVFENTTTTIFSSCHRHSSYSFQKRSLTQ